MKSIEDMLSRYGGRAYYVIKAALEIAEENRKLGLARMGDFDFKSLVLKLRSWGIEYNPSNLLKVMEREYGLVKTVYRSSNQRWWVFSDMTTVKLALEECKEEATDPDEELLTIQIAVVDVDSIIADLAAILSREKILPADEKRLREIVLNDLPRVVEVYKKALGYGSKFSDFVGKARKALELARKAALILKSRSHITLGKVPEVSIEEKFASSVR